MVVVVVVVWKHMLPRIGECFAGSKTCFSCVGITPLEWRTSVRNGLSQLLFESIRQDEKWLSSFRFTPFRGNSAKVNKDLSRWKIHRRLCRMCARTMRTLWPQIEN